MGRVTHDAVVSLEAGMDVEMPARLLRKRALPKLLRRGKLSRALAYRCAIQGTVLLKNEAVAPVLPLAADTVRRVAVIGPLADAADLRDRGSSPVHPPTTSSPLAELRGVLGANRVVHDDGSDAAAAARVAADADVAVVVLGFTADDEGESLVNDNIEGTSVLGFPFSSRPVQWLMKKATKRAPGQFAAGGDRRTLTLKPQDEALVAAVAAANRRTVVVLIGGSAILMEAWRARVPAIVMAGYPGMEGGRALADLPTGAEEPGGRLAVAIPTAAAHLPFFDPDAKTITYDAWWGQRMLDRDGHDAAFPFGHGLGYTRFETMLLRVDGDDAGTGTGATATATVRAVNAGAGEAVETAVTLDLTPTRQRSSQTRAWSPRPGDWRYVATQASPTRRQLEGLTALAAGTQDGTVTA